MTSGAIVPGSIVRHPQQPDWGDGQVQSVDKRRITVNFQQAGKRVINADHVELEFVRSGDRSKP